MKGIVFLGERQVEIREFEDPVPGADEVILEIKASGMCGSDLHVYRSPGGGPAAARALGLGGDGKAVIAGHEPCGIVVARGSEVSEKMAPLGARVMVHHYDGCRICEACQDGWAQLCKSGFTVFGITGHGSHAPYMRVPVNTLVNLPDQLTFEEGAAISCGTGTAFGAIKRMNVSNKGIIAVFGQGPVGLSATMIAVCMGLSVIAIDVSNERLKLAKKFGAEKLVNAKEDNVIEVLYQHTRGIGVDYAIECSGQPEARLNSVRSTKTWGTVCFVGEGKDVKFDVSPDLLRRQLTLLGSWTFNKALQFECARFVSKHSLPINKLFTHVFKQSEASKAYRVFDTQTTGKGVFLF